MRIIGLMLVAAMVVGCGDGYPPRVPVSGTVTFQGKPVGNANVTFLSTASNGKSASGQTDEAGNYQLTSYSPNDGAIPGDYIVTVTVIDMSGSNLDVAGSDDLGDNYTAMMDSAASSRPKTQPGGLPEKYSDASQTDLKQTVASEEPVVIDLNLE